MAIAHKVTTCKSADPLPPTPSAIVHSSPHLCLTICLHPIHADICGSDDACTRAGEAPEEPPIPQRWSPVQDNDLGSTDEPQHALQGAHDAYASRVPPRSGLAQFIWSSSRSALQPVNCNIQQHTYPLSLFLTFTFTVSRLSSASELVRRLYHLQLHRAGAARV
ncbi:hypothetical protein EDB83DRAFT_1462876 [Lactarius deliciosus]|nr:hypothetical protein EDB83DRAFT_1462876 [Lactarius deliciosus]